VQSKGQPSTASVSNSNYNICKF